MKFVSKHGGNYKVYGNESVLVILVLLIGCIFMQLALVAIVTC